MVRVDMKASKLREPWLEPNGLGEILKIVFELDVDQPRKPNAGTEFETQAVAYDVRFMIWRIDCAQSFQMGKLSQCGDDFGGVEVGRKGDVDEVSMSMRVGRRMTYVLRQEV